MTVLKTATGKTYPCDFMGIATGYDVLYLKIEADPTEAVQVFLNPEETQTLVWFNEDNGENVRTETGYTAFGGLTILPGKCPVRIRMTRPLMQGGTENAQV